VDAVRRILGILLVVALPPAIAYWLVVHPFVRRWRRLDVRVTYALLTLFMGGLGVLLFAIRKLLLGRDLGMNWPLTAVGAVLYLMAVAISLLCRTQLSLKTFVGVPEVSSAATPGNLMQSGIYGLIRHPRYLSIILATIGIALIANYLGVYVLLVVCLLGLWPLIIVEERELLSRFGPAYTAYRSRVPALLPRIRRR
jgi:protein-S-isoprenylcysteine O-methyltransferase Ste14